MGSGWTPPLLGSIPMAHPASRLSGLTYPLLHAAVKKGDVGTLTYLLSAGAALEARDSEGRTALHVALDYEQDACVALLVRAGADPHAKDHRQQGVMSRLKERLGLSPALNPLPDSPLTDEVRPERTGAHVMPLILPWRKTKAAAANAKPATTAIDPRPKKRPLEWDDVEALGGFQEDALDLKDALDARDREVRRG